MRRTPFSDSQSRILAGMMGLRLFVVSLVVLFASTLVGFLVMRLQLGLANQWPDLPPMPRILWVSTAAIVFSSITMQFSVASIRLHRQTGLRAGLLATLVLGLTFLGLQAVAWLQWVTPVTQRWGESADWRFALTSFYVFTGLHAAHVVGGLIPMAVVTSRAMGRRYSAAEHLGVIQCAMYWHFLDLVWLALYTVMAVGL
jgi:cytochrome c oxidase subunit 3